MSRYKNPPPPKNISSALNEIDNMSPDQLIEYMKYHSPVDEKGAYEPFHKFQYKTGKDIDAKIAWHIKKASRRNNRVYVEGIREKDSDNLYCAYYLTKKIQKAVSMVDRFTTSGQITHLDGMMGGQFRLKNLINSLIEDESISSSQLEGATTTTAVAKELITSNRTPRTDGEKMIVGNYLMMNFAWENRHKPLTVSLIQEMHECGVSGINDDKYTPGVFRKTNDIYVKNSDGEIVHEPPPADQIEERLERMCEWGNEEHDGEGSSEYIHPMIKAVALHFSIGYEHPFRDGNGRVARCLFYWFMFKHGYEAFKYIAISTILKGAPVQYGVSYLNTEKDEMDLTYFLDYQAEVITRAINKFNNSWEDALRNLRGFAGWLLMSGKSKEVTDLQNSIISAAMSQNSAFTARRVQEMAGCSDNTARQALNGLFDMGLFKKDKVERTTLYRLKPFDEIQKSN
ncbi:MAG: Fic family protein [Endozoicomonas sp.]|uniref:Fic family protein n=1 Tax=Endozoicomonas sp. TaxID=1892382 RepID=UPI003D9BF841